MIMRDGTDRHTNRQCDYLTELASSEKQLSTSPSISSPATKWPAKLVSRFLAETGRLTSQRSSSRATYLLARSATSDSDPKAAHTPPTCWCANEKKLKKKHDKHTHLSWANTKLNFIVDIGAVKTEYRGVGLSQIFHSSWEQLPLGWSIGQKQLDYYNVNKGKLPELQAWMREEWQPLLLRLSGLLLTLVVNPV